MPEENAVTEPATTALESSNLSLDAAAALMEQKAQPTEEAETPTEETTSVVEPETETEETEEPTPEEPEETEAEETEDEPEEEETTSRRAPGLSKVLSQLPQEQRKAAQDAITGIIERKIAKFTARMKSAEATAAQVKEDYQKQYDQLIENFKASQPVPTFSDDDPTAKIGSVAELNKARNLAQQYIDWAEEALDQDGEEIEVNGKTYERSHIKKRLREAHRDLSRNLPAREKFLATRQQAEAQARKVFPWMADPNSPESQSLKATLAQRPHLARDPEAVWLTALALNGLKALQPKAKEELEKQENKKAPKPREEPPPVETPTVVPPRRTQTSAEAEKLRQKREKVTASNMDLNGVEALLEEMERNKSG